MKKIEAKALLISIIIITIITIISASIITRYFYFQLALNNAIIELQLEANNQSAIDLLKHEYYDIMRNGDSASLDLFADGKQHVSYSKYRWGAYSIIKVASKHNHIIKQRVALIGKSLLNDSLVLYIANHGSPIMIAGKSKIIGQAYLPNKAFKKVFFEGQSQNKEDAFIYDIKSSNSLLPETDTLVLGHLRYLSQSIQSFKPISQPWTGLNQDTLFQSFYSEPIYYYNENPIHLDRLLMKGQIVLLSEKSIYVSNRTQLNDVILIAPKVEFESGTLGNFQVIATDSIIVGKKSQFSYPTALIVIANNNKQNNPLIFVDSGAVIKGSIGGYANSFNNNLKIQLKNGTLIIGTIYCQGATEVSGSINGYIISDKLFTQTSKGYYANYLNNAIINRQKLHSKFVNHNLLKASSSAQIAKWLY
jgi:hypothetical protein